MLGAILLFKKNDSPIKLFLQKPMETKILTILCHNNKILFGTHLRNIGLI